MIKKVIRLGNNMVMVFDENGEELSRYQGLYNEVRDRIIADAPAGTMFHNWFGLSLKPDKIAANSW
jgi:hypothetical protein